MNLLIFKWTYIWPRIFILSNYEQPRFVQQSIKKQYELCLDTKL